MLSLRIAVLALTAGSMTMLSAAPSVFAAPDNDDFVGAIAVSVPYSNAGNELSTGGATLEPPDEPPCVDIEATVWYAVTAPVSGTLKVSTQGSDFDTILAAYSGTMLDNLQSLGCNDDTGGGSGVTSAVQFEVVAGAIYYIQAGGYQGASGQLTLSIVYGAEPGNDDFVKAAVVMPATLPYSNSRNTIVATTEGDEPEVSPAPSNCVPQFMGIMARTVWYSFTPGQTNLMNATTAGSNFDTVLAVYTGDTLADLAGVGCSDDSDDITSAVQFVASADTTYRIQIGGYAGDSGDLVFCLAVDTSDSDCDGFTDENETLQIGTGANDPCGNDGWPADLAGNDNTLNIGDFNSFLFPLRLDGSFNKIVHPVPDPQDANIARWNLEPNGSIDIGDLNALNPAVVASTSRPPMFGGQPAFFTNLGQCPFPP